MRQSYHPDFVNSDNALFGFYFDNGGCAEHEWGIAGLRERYGINDNKLGYKRRVITKVPASVMFVPFKSKKVPCAVLMDAGRYSNIDPTNLKELRQWFRHTCYFKSTPQDEADDNWVSAAWDEGTWGICVGGKDNVAQLEELYHAIQNKDVLFYVGNPHPNNPFAKGGLVFRILSKMTDEEKNEMYEVDHDHYVLCKKAAPIIKKVEKAGKRFYALSPRWKNDDKKEVVFWLNPWDQRSNFFGWVTEQDLMDWIKGEGIIPGHGFDFERDHREEYEAMVKAHKVLG